MRDFYAKETTKGTLAFSIALMSHRAAMTGSIIRNIIASHARKIPSNIATMACVTEVLMSTDRNYATIYISAIANAESAVNYLRKRRGALKKDIGNTLTSYRVPDLRFIVDERGAHLNKLDALLQDRTSTDTKKSLEKKTQH